MIVLLVFARISFVKETNVTSQFNSSRKDYEVFLWHNYDQHHGRNQSASVFLILTKWLAVQLLSNLELTELFNNTIIRKLHNLIRYKMY